MAILPPKTSPRPIFAAHSVPSRTLSTSAFSDSLSQDLPASTHEVYTLESLHPVPLVPELAAKTLKALATLQVSNPIGKMGFA
jgi:hypothetical protein